MLRSIAPFSLEDQSGQSYGFSDLEGKVWIATTALLGSPKNTSSAAFLKDRIEQEGLWHSVRLVTVSPDSPGASEKAASLSADWKSWRPLTGERDEVTGLLESLGLPQPVRSGQRSDEGATFVLIDRAMQVRGTYDLSKADEFQALVRDMALVLPEAPNLDDGTGRTHLAVPPENLDVASLDRRAHRQRSQASTYEIFNQFEFEDRQPESGITFRNKIVDNAGKSLIPNHYDHGNGVAVADIDRDGLTDLYFSSQVGGNELWRNLGDGRFENVTEKAGVALPNRVGVTASFADIDNDGDPDLYVTTVKNGNALFLNDGQGKFTDVSARSGVDYRGHSSGALFFDYDRDGFVDLFLVNVGIYTTDEKLPVTNGTSAEQSDGRHSFYEGRDDAFVAHVDPDRAERSVLYKNLGDGTFRDVTLETGLADSSWSGDAIPLDADGDGWQDLYVLNMQGDDEYYKNEAGKRFVKKSRQLFPRTPWGTMGAKAFDYDNDNRLDLYLSDMHSDMSEGIGPEREKLKARMQWSDDVLEGGADNIFGNAFYRKTEDGRYIEISDSIGAENYWPWGLSVGDLNADGFDDAFVASSMNYPFRYGVNSVLLNDRGQRFLDSEFIVRVEPRRDGRTLTPWFELDCDGPDKSHEYCERRSGDVVVWAALGSRSSAIFDIDDDGDLDIVTNDFNSEPMVLMSNLSERKPDLRFLKVRLRGRDSNRDGLGANVIVEAGGRTYTKVMDGVTGYLSHGVQPLYYGLGDARSVDRVTVHWPSGATQILEGPFETNRLLGIEEQ